VNLPKYNYQTALDQLLKCNFECEAGSLKNNAAFLFLQQQRDVLKFLPGQTVYVEIEYKSPVNGKTMKKWEPATIVGCTRDSGTDNVYYDYLVSQDPCQPWHYGSGSFRVKERDMRLSKEGDQ